MFVSLCCKLVLLWQAIIKCNLLFSMSTQYFRMLFILWLYCVSSLKRKGTFLSPLFFCLPAYLIICLPASLSACLLDYMPAYLPAYLITCLHVCLFSCLSTWLHAYLHACLLDCLPTCLLDYLIGSSCDRVCRRVNPKNSCLPACLVTCLKLENQQERCCWFNFNKQR